MDIQLDDVGTSSEVAPTEMCQLEPAEDSFLELGKSSMEQPDAVTKWDAGDALADSKVAENGNKSSLRLVGASHSSAWFELVVLEHDVKPGFHAAATLALEIEVGNGSWDSSLIQAATAESGATDLVTFDVVVAYEKLE